MMIKDVKLITQPICAYYRNSTGAVRLVPKSTREAIVEPESDRAAVQLESVTPSTSSDQKSDLPLLRWRRAFKWSKRIVAALTTVPTLLFAGWIVIQVVAATFRSHTLDLQAIPVPKSLADSGLSSEVVTRQLRDVVQEMHTSARTSSAKSSVDLSEDAINIVIPKAGISVDTVATSIRSLLHETLQHEISGEITQSDAGVFSMRLRVNGNLIFDETYSGPDAASILIRHAASKLVFETEPYIAAFWIYRDGHGDLKDANLIADRLIVAYPPDKEAISRAYNLKGLIAQQQGNNDTAAYFFRKAVPNLPIAWSNIGNIFYSQGRLEEAKRAYEKTIRLTPDDPYPYYRLGDVYDDQGNLTKALEVYNRGLEYDGTSPYLHRGRGTVFTEQGKIREAKAEYQIALSSAPNYFGAHYGLGNVLRAEGSVDEAEREYRTSIKLISTYEAPHTGLGDLLSDQGKIEEAISEYRLALKLNPTSAAAYDGLSAALLRKGDKNEAIADYLSAVRLNPKFAFP